jgi:hypothetical protein
MLQASSAPAHLNSASANTPFGQFNSAPLDLAFTPNNPAFFAAAANYGMSPLDGQGFGLSPLGGQAPLVPCSMTASEGILGKCLQLKTINKLLIFSQATKNSARISGTSPASKRSTTANVCSLVHCFHTECQQSK